MVRPKGSTGDGPSYIPKEMNIDSWMWRPVLEGVLSFKELDGWCSLSDIAEANEALDVKEEAADFHRRRAE